MRYLDLDTSQLTLTELTLPANWENALEYGVTDGLSEREAMLIERIRMMHGELALASPDVEYRHDHDAIEAGTGPCECRVYAFIEEHHAYLH